MYIAPHVDVYAPATSVLGRERDAVTRTIRVTPVVNQQSPETETRQRETDRISGERLSTVVLVALAHAPHPRGRMIPCPRPKLALALALALLNGSNTYPMRTGV
jgi:hypothetical protein